ncbi:MAG: ComF family protein [Flavobacteriales bacterium]|nr:ComF family protein [Flavobacteriales bacterium]
MKLPAPVSDVLELVFPRLCVVCEGALLAEENHVCMTCLNLMPRFSAREKERKAVEKLFYARLPFEFIVAYFAFDKKARVQRLMHAIKYRENPELARWVGRLLGHQMLEEQNEWPVDWIVPVPLHPRKLRQRGYNQSAWFARGLAEVLHKPVREEAAQRVVNTRSQTGMNKTRRWENVKEAFSCPTSLEGLKILLVDDVLTTGATLEACGKALVKAGATAVSVAVMASAFGHD